MKKEEQMARNYFESIGFKEIHVEPDGNVPPDLLLEGRIAVEVRRLNKHINGEPIERLGGRLVLRVLNCIKAFDHIPSTQSAWVGFDYKRPLRVDKTLENHVNQILNTHLSHLDESAKYYINDNFQVRFRPTRRSYGKPYIFGSRYDGNHGGSPLGDILDNLKIVIPEKVAKIEKFKGNYETWWLALIDNVDGFINDDDIKTLRKAFKNTSFFSKIILISCYNELDGKEIT